MSNSPKPYGRPKNAGSAEPTGKPRAPWAALFDVDGTMVNNALFHKQAWIAFGRKHGLPIDRAYYFEHIHSRSNEATVRHLFGQEIDPSFIDALAAEKEALYRDLYRDHIVENRGLSTLLQALYEAGVPCAAVSNAPPKNMHMILDALGVKPWLTFSIALDGSLPGKPAPDLYRFAARSLETPIQHCVIFEDSVSGFKAAEAAGAPYVVISGAAHETCLEEATRAKAIHRDFTSLSVNLLASLMHL